MPRYTSYARLRAVGSFRRTALIILLVLWGVGLPLLLLPIGIASAAAAIVTGPLLGIGWLGGMLLLGLLALLAPNQYRLELEQPADAGDIYVDRAPPRFE